MKHTHTHTHINTKKHVCTNTHTVYYATFVIQNAKVVPNMLFVVSLRNLAPVLDNLVHMIQEEESVSYSVSGREGEGCYLTVQVQTV